MKSDTSTNPYRCAIYFTPAPFTEWWMAGTQWLGRCAITGATPAPPDIPGLSPEVFGACTADPRRYGWHATLKAPFTLSPEKTLPEVVSRMRELGSRLQSFTLPPLRVSTEGGFLALRPQGDTAQIEHTAAACVQDLHDLALPLSAVELARRRRVPLTPDQDRLLVQWGYPWVLSHFQFHLSLTGPLQPLAVTERQALVQAAEGHFHALPSCRFEHLALFTEAEKGADFQLAHLVDLHG